MLVSLLLDEGSNIEIYSIVIDLIDQTFLVDVVDISDLKIAPRNKKSIISPKEIAQILSKAVGIKYSLSGKSRTDGSNIRKIVSNILVNTKKPELAVDGTVEILQRKGLPKLLAYCIDTYIVTSGDSYNLQVWNRFPNSETPLVRYQNSEVITSKEIYFTFIKIENSIIDSVVIASPSFIEKNFGNFGVPTIKHQLIISDTLREKISKLNPAVLYEKDTDAIQKITLCKEVLEQSASIKDEPVKEKLYKLDVIKDTLAARMIGMELPELQTKNKWQLIEREVTKLLGYDSENTEFMEGNYPDIRHQLLEIKVQDSPTVDLGKFSPLSKQKGFSNLNVTTEDVRYFIALVDRKTKKVSSLVIMPGKEFSKHFSYVSETSFKCQRSIPMDFFNNHSGKSVFLG